MIYYFDFTRRRLIMRILVRREKGDCEDFVCEK